MLRLQWLLLVLLLCSGLPLQAEPDGVSEGVDEALASALTEVPDAAEVQSGPEAMVEEVVPEVAFAPALEAEAEAEAEAELASELELEPEGGEQEAIELVQPDQAGLEQAGVWEDAPEGESDPEYEYIYVYEEVAGESEAGQSSEPKGWFEGWVSGKSLKDPVLWLPVLALSWLALLRLGRRRNSTPWVEDDFSIHLSHKGRKEVERSRCESRSKDRPTAF